MYDGGQLNQSELQSRVEIYDDNKMNINTQHRIDDQAKQDMQDEGMDDMDDTSIQDEGEDAPEDMMGDTKEILAMASQINTNTYSATDDVNGASQVTDNLRNFMEQAQPGEGLLFSQSANEHSSNNVMRKDLSSMQQKSAPKQGEQIEQQPFDLRKQDVTGDRSSQSDKEGGSIEQNRLNILPEPKSFNNGVLMDSNSQIQQ